MRPDGVTSFSMIQAASDSGNAAALVFFLFDLLHLDGEDLCPRSLIERKARLAALLSDARSPLHYCDHQIGHGREFHKQACAMSLEGIVSKRANAAYARQSRLVAQGQMSAPRGICRDRLDRSRRHAAVARRFAAHQPEARRTPRRLIFLCRENTIQSDVLCETPIKRCDLTLVGGSKCFQYGTPFLRLGQIDQQVEWFSQGISKGWPFQGQVRKDETDEEALFGVIRTLEQVRRLRSEGNQPGKRDFELAVGLVAVLEQAVYFLLPLGDLLVFSIIDVPGNSPKRQPAV